MKRKILVVDDKADIVILLTDRLEALGYDTRSANDGEHALRLLEEYAPHVMLLDLEMPRMSGLEVLQYLNRERRPEFEGDKRISARTERLPDVPVIVMTAFGSIEKAVEAMKAGAYDFLTKPIDFDHLSIVLNKAFKRQVLERQVASLRTAVEDRYGTIVGRSPMMVSLVELAKRAADSDATVLLLGESGTGKELFARSIHRWSARCEMPFSVINCVALTESLLENELFGHEKGAYTGADCLRKGKIEEADGGTLFLDEIGDMPLPLQSKFLRVLQDHEFPRVGGTRPVKVNIRVIAATNKDLRQAVRDGAFREDLFFRLNVVPLSLPPLRERPEDIVPLAEFFLDRHVKEMKKSPRRFSTDAVEAMGRYPWPGNIRELDNAIARAVVLGTSDTITAEHLGLNGGSPASFDEQLLPYHESMERYSRFVLERALRHCNWSQTKAAELLGLQRTYLSRLLKQKNISIPPPRSSS
ncbi:MAG: sigma-54-dependent Fis family transcriptional regulator [Nitrospirae bacterium]|nr:MAG: sigma-54-dependent Fis family transcriptional regulator [Nitrospirota bacterium]